jgi:hypothetical protein
MPMQRWKEVMINPASSDLVLSGTSRTTSA